MQYRRSKAKGATFFFTVVTHGRERTLCDNTTVETIKRAFIHVKAKFPFVIDAFVLLPDHIHCVWTLPENDSDFSKRWRLIKSYYTRRCSAAQAGMLTPSMATKGERTIWQRRFWEHTIVDEDDFRKHVEYIHYNPVKHGLVKSPKDWPYSSFHRHVSEGSYSLDWGAEREIVFDESIGRE